MQLRTAKITSISSGVEGRLQDFDRTESENQNQFIGRRCGRLKGKQTQR